jgi:hypothetical protein
VTGNSPSSAWSDGKLWRWYEALECYRHDGDGYTILRTAEEVLSGSDDAAPAVGPGQGDC